MIRTNSLPSIQLSYNYDQYLKPSSAGYIRNMYIQNFSGLELRLKKITARFDWGWDYWLEYNGGMHIYPERQRFIPDLLKFGVCNADGVHNCRIVVDVEDAYTGTLYSLELEKPLEVVVTPVEPVITTFFSRSIRPEDQWKVDPIKKNLKLWAMRPNTIGDEIIPEPETPENIRRVTKQVVGECDGMVVLATRRDQSALTGSWKPSPWLQVEPAMSVDVDIDMPVLIIREQETDIEGILSTYPKNHVVEYDPYYLESYRNELWKIMPLFRNECLDYRSTKNSRGLGKLVGLLVAGWFVYELGKASPRKK